MNSRHSKKALGADGGDGHTTLCLHAVPLNCAFANG